jgi:hypothetical protein
LLEKAREGKKIANLETARGKNHSSNSFAILRSDDVEIIAKVAGIDLGVDENDRKESVPQVLSRVETNEEVLNKTYVVCLSKEGGGGNPVSSIGKGDEEGVVAHSTPLGQIVQPQVDELGEDKGHWTPIVCRKRSKTRLPQ